MKWTGRRVESVGGKIIGKRENPEKNPKNPDSVHYRYHFAGPVARFEPATAIMESQCSRRLAN